MHISLLFFGFPSHLGHHQALSRVPWATVSQELSVLCISSVQFSSVAQSCPTFCDPMNCSTPGLPVHHHLPEFTDSRPSSQWCHPAISSLVVPFSCPQSLPASESFPTSQLLLWGGQSIAVYICQFQPLNSSPSPLESIFSFSVSLFLLCKYRFLRT